MIDMLNYINKAHSAEFDHVMYHTGIMMFNLQKKETSAYKLS